MKAEPGARGSQERCSIFSNRALNFLSDFEMSNAIQTYVDDAFVVLIPQKHICEMQQSTYIIKQALHY